MRAGDVVRTLLVGALAALGGYLAGRFTGEDRTRSELQVALAERDRLQESLDRLPSPSSPGPRPLEPSPSLVPPRPADRPTPPAGAHPAAGLPGAGLPAPAAPSPTPLGFDDVVTGQELGRRLLALLQRGLAEGPSGHLELLRLLDRLFAGDTRTQHLLDDDPESVAALYPVLRFLAQHDTDLAALVETVLRTMAETPQALAGLDSDLLEFFTQGLALILPAILDAERMTTVRGYVDRTLAAPPTSLPESVRRNLDELARLRAAWTPPPAAAEILAVLAGPSDAPETTSALQHARRLTPADWAGTSIDVALGPHLRAGSWDALFALRAAQPDAVTIQALDARLLAVTPGTEPEHAGLPEPDFVREYLAATGRTSWATARGFLEGWVAAGGGMFGGLPGLLGRLSPPPTSQDYRDLAARPDVSEANRTHLLEAAAR